MRQTNMARSLFRAILLFGAGVAVGLLTAPKTGRGSRAWIGQKFDHFEANTSNWRDKLMQQARYQQGRLTGAAHKMKQLTLVPAEDEYVDDDLITQRVRTRIGENPGTWHLPRINVDTADRIVTLRGRVQTKAERDAMEQVTLSTPDVESIVNKITVAGRRAAS